MTDTKHKVAIIGSGPAGLTAAIYTTRAELDTTVFTGMQPGGQPTITTEIENFPGFPDGGITGPELSAKMQKQAEDFGAKVEFGEIKNIEKKGKGFVLTDMMGQEREFDGVIIATGSSPRYLGLPEEKDYIGKGHHTCATCDGFFYKGKTIAIVGGGDSAMEEANYLTKHANKVYLIHRSEEFRASNIMFERAKNNPKIEFLTNKKVSKLIGEKRVDKIELTDTQTNQKSELELDGIFLAIGHIPNTEFLEGFLEVDEQGYLIKEKGRTKSSVEGVFVAGDVGDPIYKQAITAAAGGCKAAIDCERWLENQ